MQTADAKSNAALGFLTVLDHSEHGLFGGYLVLNSAGRPLEFHCTAPIKPNRAQQILYGPTLEPFLYGEQIGRTLLDRARTEPLLVCTDRPPVLAVRQYVQTPVALVLRDDGAEDSEPKPDGCVRRDGSPEFDVQDSELPTVNSQLPIPPSPDTVWRLDAAHGGPALVGFQLGRNRLAVADTSHQDRRLVAQRIAGLAESFDLAEPFGRIREAIEEARRGRQSG